MKIIIFILIICIFIGISSASATDADNQVMGSTSTSDVASDIVGSSNDFLQVSSGDLGEQNSLLKSTGNENILKDSEENGTFQDLNKLIKTTPDELVLDKNYVYSSTDSCLEINKNNYVIDFNGHTLDANSTSTRTVMKINGNNVTIKNLKFINGYGKVSITSYAWSNPQGSIEWNGDNGVLDNITITQSCVPLIWYGEYGVMNNSLITQLKDVSRSIALMSGKHFSLSNTIVKDLVYNNDNAIMLDSYSTAYNCTFNNTGSASPLSAGFNSGQSDITISHCNWYGNGYMNLQALRCKVEYCSFTNSVFSNGLIYFAGIAINCIIDNCNFTNCQAGCAVGRTDARSLLLTVSNCRFIDNNFKYVTNANNFTNCLVENNTLTDSLHNHAATISNCNFTNNTITSSENAGIVVTSNSVETVDMFLENCKFINNTGITQGIIKIKSNVPLVRVYNSYFTTNSGEYDGWAIYSTVSGAKLYYDEATKFDNKTTYDPVLAPNRDSTLRNNLWVTSQDKVGGDGSQGNPYNLTYGLSIIDTGGTVNFLNDGIYTITQQYTISKEITLKGNGATITRSNGNIFSVTEIGRYTVIDNFIFENCGETTASAILSITGHSCTISNSTFINNKAGNTDLITVGNTAGAGRFVTFDNCTFKDNTAGCIIKFNTCLCTVKNCRFDNNTAVYSTIFLYSTGLNTNTRNFGFNLTNSNFTNNKATSTSSTVNVNQVYPAGAVAITAPDSSVSGCRFENNSAYLAGALAMNYAETIEDCIFINNTGTMYGAVYINTKGEITGSTFKNNKQTDASYGGGAIFTANSISIADCVFESNIAAAKGGAIYTPSSSGLSLSISNSNFTNHSATVVDLRKYSATFNGCNFLNNTAVCINAFDGGSSQTLTVNGTNFKFNKLEDVDGVAINSSVKTSISYCNFINNTAGVGIVILKYAESTVLESNFINNTAENASAIYIEGENVKIKSSNFTNNNATNTSAVYIIANYCQITESIFTANRAPNAGAAVYIANNTGGEKFYYYIDSATWSTCGLMSGYNDVYDAYGQTLMGEVYVILNPDDTSSDRSGRDRDNPTFFEVGFNRVAPDGYIIFVNASEVYTSFGVTTDEHAAGDPYNGALYTCEKYGVKFMGNNTTIVNLRFITATSAYGIEFHNITFKGSNKTAIIVNSTDCIVDNCSFIDNNGVECVKGGALQVLGENLTIINTTFKNNAVKNDTNVVGGGAIYSNAVVLNITGCTFDSNIADAGAHIFFDEYGDNPNYESTSITDSTFKNGGKYTADGSSLVINRGYVTIRGSNFTSNVGDGDGGAIDVIFAGESLIIENNNFTSNHAANGGAIAFCNGAYKDMSFTGNYFGDNVASSNGGAIYNKGSLTISDNDFTNNTADYGGAIFWNSAANGVVSDCTFNNNNASVGGAIFWEAGANGIVSYCTFNNNNASSAGGIYWNSNSVNGTVSDCTFNNNTAQAYAGAIRVNGDGSTIRNCTFNNNSVTQYGGAVSWSGTNGTVSNCTFNNNTAGSVGGAILWDGPANGTVIDCRFNNNKAGDRGGAIRWGGANGVVSKSTFTNNNATNGGAIYLESTATSSNIVDCNFTKNNATNGGAVYVGADSSITGCIFRENNATNGGAVYIASGKTLNVNNVEAYDNTYTTQNHTHYGTFYIVGATLNDKNLVLGDHQDIYDGNVHADIIYVSNTGSADNYGLTSDTPTTLEHALVEVNPNGKIIFANDTYTIAQSINKNVTLVGNGSTFKRDQDKYLYILGLYKGSKDFGLNKIQNQ